MPTALPFLIRAQDLWWTCSHIPGCPVLGGVGVCPAGSLSGCLGQKTLFLA